MSPRPTRFCLTVPHESSFARGRRQGRRDRDSRRHHFLFFCKVKGVAGWIALLRPAGREPNRRTSGPSRRASADALVLRSPPTTSLPLFLSSPPFQLLSSRSGLKLRYARFVASLRRPRSVFLTRPSPRCSAKPPQVDPDSLDATVLSFAPARLPPLSPAPSFARPPCSLLRSPRSLSSPRPSSFRPRPTAPVASLTRRPPTASPSAETAARTPGPSALAYLLRFHRAQTDASRRLLIV